MIPADTFSGQKVAVMGLARSGLSAVRSLVAGGALVAAWDDAEAARTEAEAAGIPLTEPRAIDWANTAALVLSPGIPDRHPEPNETASAARDAGCPILCDVDLLARARPEACYIGITGWVCDERRGQHLLPLLGLIPDDRLLIETDAPYLLPRSLKPKPKSRRCEPKHLVEVCRFMSSVLDIPAEALADRTYTNANRFFGLN